MDDDFFRPLRLSLPSAGRFDRSRQFEVTLIPDWTALADADGQPLPPQEWPGQVATAMVTALELAEGFIEDGDARSQLVLRLLAASAADVDGTMLARAFQVNEYCVLGLTVTLLDPPATEASMDEQAEAAHAEATMLSSAAAPRYLRLARDGRTGDVSSDLLIALAGEDRPAEVKRAESMARADALLERSRNPPLDEAEPEIPDSAEIWLRFVMPVTQSDARLALTFCGYGDSGMRMPLSEANRVAASLQPGRG